VFAINAVGFVLGAQVCSRLIGRASPTRILSITLPGLVLASAALAFAGLLDRGLVPVVALTAVFFTLAGASLPCNSVMAMWAHKARAGTAAALMGAVTFGLGGVAAPLTGSLGIESVAPTGIVMGAASALALVLFRLFVLHHSSDGGGPSEAPWG
jgi:DHA1 family bicyclomycin/chloramphenicol resistance-like MFS transporter